MDWEVIPDAYRDVVDPLLCHHPPTGPARSGGPMTSSGG
jgi:hypothetical protein